MTQKQLIETMTRTINSLLKGEVNDELSAFSPEDSEKDGVYALADSIKKLNNKLSRNKELVSDISPGNYNKAVEIKSKPPKPIAHLKKQIQEENKPAEINILNKESYHDLFSEMEKAFALFEIVYDKHGKPVDYIFLEVNEFFEMTTGLKHTDVIGKEIKKVFKRTSKLWMDTCNSVAADGITRQIEYYSEEFEFDINVIAFRTTQGKLSTITTNVTKRKTIEKRLRLYAYVIQSISEYVSITDMNDNLIFVNNAFLKAYGYKENELLGKPVTILRPDNKQQKEVKEILPKTIVNGRWSGALWNQKKDGTNFYIRLSTSIVKDEMDNPVALVGVARDITVQNLVKESLKNYVSLLNATLNSTVDGIVGVNLEGKTVIHNEQFLKMLDLSPEVMTSLNDEFVLTHISGLLENKINFDVHINALNSKSRDTHSDVLILKDGRTFEMSSRPQLIDGKPVGRVWSFHDITKHQRMNKELLESRTKLSLAMGLVKLANWEYDAANDLFIFNDEFYELYGTTVEKEGSYFMSPETYTRKFVHPDEKNIVAEELKRTLETKDADYCGQLEHKIIRGDGKICSIVVRNAVIKDDSGKTIRVYGANQDITESKETIEALLNSEIKYRKISEYINDVFYQTDKDGILIDLSPSIRRYTGYSREELVGQPTTKIYNNPDDRKVLLKEVIEKGNVIDFEVTMKDKEGNPLYASVSSHAIYNEKGEFAGVEGSMRDTSERKKNEQEIKRINEELRELNATKDKFFSIIAHDLKSPFQGLLGYSDLLLNEYNTLSEEERFEYVGSINNLSKGAYKLLENLLHWARLQTNKIVSNTDFFNLNEALKSPIYLMREAAKKKNIHIQSVIDRKIFIIADLDMLQTVIRNLISNSIKFTNPYGEITISAVDLGDKIKICVEDTGVGMSKENVEKLFKIEKSFSTKGTKNEEGTGLGLLLCKEMIDIHEGEIWAESEPGKGTKFFITLPVDNDYR